MEAIFMDSLFNTTRVLDMFSSFIWNDKYCGYGDFEIRLPMTDDALIGIREGNFVSIRETDRYMIVEGINISTSLEEGNHATISGRSLESILERRIVYENTTLTGSLQQGVLRLLNANIISPENVNRKVPNLSFMTSEDPEITSLSLDLEVKAGENLYDVVYDICDSNHLGFAIIPEIDGGMHFILYKGIDRSYAQTKNPWVVFSPKFENLKSTEMDMDTEDLKNCIIARSEYTETVRKDLSLTHIAKTDGSLLKTKFVDDGTATDKPEEEVTERRIEIKIGDEITGLDRREIFKSSREIPEEIDEEAFGKPEDRVDRRKYESWEPISFDRAGYEKALEEGLNKYYTHSQSIPKEHYEWKHEWMKPGDPGYNPNLSNVGQSHTVQVFVPGATKEEADKIKQRNDRLWDECIPRKSSFTRYGWVLTDKAGYERALKEAQAEIDAEIAAAKQTALETTQGIIRGDAETELAKHLVISSFEGELDPSVQYIYGRDYFVGDLVQIVNEFDFQASTRVVSMMFSEEEGIGFIARPSFESDDKAVFEI